MLPSPIHIAMERSSPLAALQPSCIQPSWSQPMPDFDQKFLCPSRNFNFRDLSMLKSKSDYFTFQPIRGSSPTASLAADLSQNFHIDQTPQAATPRRSLFTNVGNSGLTNSNNPLLTPPIPSSSPMPESDAMDCSPLPHKPPFAAKSQIQLLPTPDPTPVIDEGHFPGELDPASLLPAVQSPPRQRKLSIGRPAFKKGYSSNAVPARPRTAEAFSHPFIFGSTSSRLSQAPSLESFAESPPSERKPSPNSLLTAAPLPRLNFPNNGSPLGVCGVKRPARRQGLGRRTQSLQYNNPLRPMRQEKRCCTQGAIVPLIEAAPEHTLRLPHFRSEDDGCDALPRITAETMVKVLEGQYASDISNLSIIDCRFEYEYQGGHIQGAINFNDKDSLKKELFVSEPSSGSRTIIFHCEYSAHRAPRMAKAIREEDRMVNQDCYPHLSYPDMYILDGGYSAFFESNSNFCFPQSYKRMDAEEHAEDCERGMAKVKRRAKLSRAQTYAFGQHAAAPGPSTILTSGMPPPPMLQTRSASSIEGMTMMDIDFEQAVTLEAQPQLTTRVPRRFDSY